MGKKFWDNVLSEINKKKLTQKELANLSGVSRTVINNGIGHYHKASVDNAFKIAQALGISVEFLMTGNLARGLSDDESELLRIYRDIPKRGRSYALQQLKIVLENERKAEAEIQAGIHAGIEAALSEDTKAGSGA